MSDVEEGREDLIEHRLIAIVSTHIIVYRSIINTTRSHVLVGPFQKSFSPTIMAEKT